MSPRIKKRVAIFDIDGTIFRSSLLIELVEALIQGNIFSAGFRKKYEQEYKEWLNRQGSYEKYILALVLAFNENIKGVRYADFTRVGRRVIAFHQSRVYRYTRDLIKQLKAKKYYLLAVSHSPMEIVQDFAKGLGFDKVYGRIYEVGKNRRFTGARPYDHLIDDKGKILLRAAEKENLTLKGSVGVGDTESDVAFLEIVHKPICFNPNEKLYKRAKRRGWSIVVERKDVVYHL